MVAREVFEEFSNLAAVEGRGFVAIHYTEDLSKDAGNDTTNCLVENPGGSGIYVVLSAPVITADRAIEITTYKNVTIDVAGTPETTINQRTDGSDSAITDVQHDIQFSGGTSYGTDQLPGGGFAEVGGVSEDNAILIAPGDNYLIHVKNDSAGTIDVGIKFKFAETLEKNIPSPWSP